MTVIDLPPTVPEAPTSPLITMSRACPVFAFTVSFAPATLREDARGAVVDAFLACTRELGLEASARSIRPLSNTLDFLVRGEAMQACDADRDAVERWLRQRPGLAHWTVGALHDLHEE